jgi:hypothetical protein
MEARTMAKKPKWPFKGSGESAALFLTKRCTCCGGVKPADREHFYIVGNAKEYRLRSPLPWCL